jgi:hypothetical protein
VLDKVIEKREGGFIMTAQIDHAEGRQEDVLLPLLSKIAGFIFETENPLSHAYEIVSQTAISHQADISTLFVIEQNKLVLKGGVAFLGGNKIALSKALHSYDLKWTVREPEDMKRGGITAYVAITGRALGIDSLEELIAHPCHHGGWDPLIYPDRESIYNPDTGFGCMYAVPIKRSQKGEPKDTVLGVFKIERRRNRPSFSKQDKKIFDLVAAHLSLLLQTYHRVQNRVFSDVAHAIGGGLGRSRTIITMCEEVLKHKDTNPAAAFDHLKKNLPKASEMLDKAIQRLASVLDAARDPMKTTDIAINRFWDSIRTEVELKANIKLDENKALLSISPPLSNNTILQLSSLQYLDISSILGNLLENAVRHSGASKPVYLKLSLKKDTERMLLLFEVEDLGKGIRPEVVQGIENTAGEIFHLPGTTGVGSGTGLQRVYGLANVNKWEVTYDTGIGTRFKIATPDFRLQPKKKEEKDD